MDDPRPLPGEPLALDLLNTVFVEDGRRRDLLEERGGDRTWLAVTGHARAPVGPKAHAALLEARTAIRTAIERPGDAAALNAVLARGHLAERLGPDGPQRTVECDEECWRVPWLAAQNLLELLRAGPDRIRRCAGHECVLHFYDASRAGRRLWCSMAGCGNRAKAQTYRRRET